MSDDIPPASNPALGIETETVSEDEQESHVRGNQNLSYDQLS